MVCNLAIIEAKNNKLNKVDYLFEIKKSINLLNNLKRDEHYNSFKELSLCR